MFRVNQETPIDLSRYSRFYKSERRPTDIRDFSDIFPTERDHLYKGLGTKSRSPVDTK